MWGSRSYPKLCFEKQNPLVMDNMWRCVVIWHHDCLCVYDMDTDYRATCGGFFYRKLILIYRYDATCSSSHPSGCVKLDSTYSISCICFMKYVAILVRTCYAWISWRGHILLTIASERAQAFHKHEVTFELCHRSLDYPIIKLATKHASSGCDFQPPSVYTHTNVHITRTTGHISSQDQRVPLTNLRDRYPRYHTNCNACSSWTALIRLLTSP